MKNTNATRVNNKYKTRNILSLADRVQVIREYDSHFMKPSIQRLANKFECSTMQIKNILLCRDSILKSCREVGENDSMSCQEGGENDHEEIYNKRQEKIDFLGKVLYEYIQRMLYYNYPIDENKVRLKALEIRECIAIENFQPSNGWFKNFKITYGIPDFNPETLRDCIRLMENKRPHLSILDMIEFVSRRQRRRGRPSCNEKLQQQNHNLLEPLIVYETIDDDKVVHNHNVHDANDDDDDGDDDDDDDDEIIHNNNQRRNNDADSDDDDDVQIVAPYGHNNNNTNTNNSYQSNKQSSLLSLSPPPLKCLRSNSPLPDIGSPEDALKHVKCLEEYAMLQDNFRAIGLLTQLEQIFKKKLKQS